MKLWMVVTGSGSPAISKNSDMNRFVSAGIEGDIICHPARTSGVLSMSSRVFAATSIDGGSEVGNSSRHRALDGRQLETDRSVHGFDGGRMWDAAQGGLQRADTTAL